MRYVDRTTEDPVYVALTVEFTSARAAAMAASDVFDAIPAATRLLLAWGALIDYWEGRPKWMRSPDLGSTSPSPSTSSVTPAMTSSPGTRN